MCFILCADWIVPSPISPEAACGTGLDADLFAAISTIQTDVIGVHIAVYAVRQIGVILNVLDDGTRLCFAHTSLQSTVKDSHGFLFFPWTSFSEMCFLCPNESRWFF